MADLKVTIGADISQYQAGMAQAGRIATETSGSVTAALARMSEGNQALGGSAMSASQAMMQMRSGLSAVRDGAMGAFVGGQRADMMFMAMGHHFTTLVSETGSLGGAFKALGSSLMGAGGVIIGLTLAYELIQKFAKSESDAYDATKNFTSVADAQHSVIQNLDGSYGEAVKNIYELTENVKLAKEGFISKSEVVKEYNETLGKTMGTVKTLDEVEQKLVANGAAYVKMMLYKAAAQTALKEASDKAVLAAKEQYKSDSESLSFIDKTLNVLGRFGSAGTGGGGPVNAGSKSDQEAAKQAQQNRDEQKAAYEKDGNDLLKIADDFQKKAAVISKQHGFSFLDQDKDGKKGADGFAIIQQQIDEATNKLQDAIMAGKGTTIINLLGAQVDELTEKLKKYNIEQDIALNPHTINPILKGISFGSERGMGNGVDDGGLLPNSGVHSFGDSDLTNGGLGNQEQTAAAMKKSTTDLFKYKDGLFEAFEAQKKFNAEQKLASEYVNVFGRGLETVFQNALSGTQGFVSGMVSFLEQLIIKFAAAAAAAEILNLVTGGATGGFMGIFSQLSGLKNLGNSGVGDAIGNGLGVGMAMAEGGVVTGPTRALVGEAGPEAVIPLNRWKEFQPNNGNSDNQNLQITHKISGADLLLTINRAQKQKGRLS